MMLRSPLIWLTFLVLAGCYTPRYVYSPVAHNMPLLTQKGQASLGGNYSTNIGNRNSAGSKVRISTASGYDLQGAYAINRRWIITSAFYKRHERNDGDYSSQNLDSSVIRYRRTLYDIGAGYIIPLVADKMYLHVFGGIGFGKFGFTDIGADQSGMQEQHFHQAHASRIFLQPALSLMSSAYVSTTISSRFSSLHFSHIRTDYSADQLDSYQLDSISYSPTRLWEPAIIQTFHFKKVPGFSLQYQAGLSMLLSRNFVDVRPFNFSIGIFADPVRLFHR